ncbi:MAG: hypothetical protein GXO55_03785 [Chloroflexi bacterium]|nr:hypothetical protein [Chloroflexota bacterium]
MLATFVDRALALLDRRFLVGYWMPAFLFGLLLFFTAGWAMPWLGLTAENYFKLEGLRLSGITLGLLLLVTVMAYVLHAFTRPIIRVYEGYWPWRWLQERGIRHQTNQWRSLRGQRDLAVQQKDRRRYNHLQARLYRDFPPREDRILPTRLGNVMRAAEDYSKTRYGLDGVFWWPRLEPLLPESLLTRLEAAYTGLVALLNLTTLIILYALLLLGNTVAVFAGCLRPTLFAWAPGWIVGAALSFILAYLIYRGAITQARAFGDLIRVAYDEHRFRILDALHMPYPQTPVEEHQLWRRLYRWLYQQDLDAARKVGYRLGNE